jgi:hypothetical protein
MAVKYFGFSNVSCVCDVTILLFWFYLVYSVGLYCLSRCTATCLPPLDSCLVDMPKLIFSMG